MSISTGTGDAGQTGLWSGERVDKDHARVEAYGTVDELSAHLGDARHVCQNEGVVQILLEVQRGLFQLAGQLASRDKKYVEALQPADVTRLEDQVHELEAQLGLKGFVIPGNTVSSARLDICRTVCRRAERRIISLSHQEKVDPVLLKWVNRLSDLLFLLARLEEKEQGKLLYKNDIPIP